EIQDQDREQQQPAPRQVNRQEFPGGVEPARAAEAGDQQEHRDGLQLPEEEEEQVIQRGENPVNAGLQDQQQDEILFRLLAHPAGSEHGEEEEEAAEQEQRHADAIDAEVIAGAGSRKPGAGLFVGKASALIPKAYHMTTA